MNIPAEKLNALIDACDEHLHVLDGLIAKRVKSAEYVKERFLEKRDSFLKDLKQKTEGQIWKELTQLLPSARDLDSVGFPDEQHPAYNDSWLKILKIKHEITDLLDPDSA